MMTPGRIAYEEDVRLEPSYLDGASRRSWDQLPDLAKQSWERNPTVRARGRPATLPEN